MRQRDNWGPSLNWIIHPHKESEAPNPSNKDPIPTIILPGRWHYSEDTIVARSISSVAISMELSHFWRRLHSIVLLHLAPQTCKFLCTVVARSIISSIAISIELSRFRRRLHSVVLLHLVPQTCKFLVRFFEFLTFFIWKDGLVILKIFNFCPCADLPILTFFIRKSHLRAVFDQRLLFKGLLIVVRYSFFFVFFMQSCDCHTFYATWFNLRCQVL